MQMPKGRVLIVDEEPSVLASYAATLSKAGFKVAEVSSGVDALGCIERYQFDAVFSAASIAAMDRFDFLRRLRVRSLELPVILMLDRPDNQAVVRGMEFRAFQSLVKPITAKLLAETAAHAVRFYRSRRSVPTMLLDSHTKRPGAVSISATKAKNEFAGLLEKVIQGSTVVITKHDSPKAVLVSIGEFDALSRASHTKLDRLSGEFDALLARMQTPSARAGMQAAFDATPKQLGKAAVSASRKRG